VGFLDLFFGVVGNHCDRLFEEKTTGLTGCLSDRIVYS
jgi:hypothetical protein